MEDQGALDGFTDEFMCNNFLTVDDMTMDLTFQDLNFDNLSDKAFDGSTTQPIHDLLLPETDDHLLDDYLQQSDSSDSGIYPSAVKEEPLSPSSISGSDVSEGYGSSTDGHTIKIESVKVEPFTEMPHTVTAGLPGQVALPLVTQATLTTTPSAAAIPFISHHGDDRGTIFINSVPGTTVLGGPPPPQTSIHNILNSKIKIQPKPLQSCASPPAVAAAAAAVVAKETHQPTVMPAPRPISSSQQLVVTPQQFQQMTAQGTLRWQQPNPAQPDVNCRNSLSELDSKQRRQQRMIKNRESASLSRKRKKEYLQELENRVKVLTTENEELRSENITLRSKLQEIQHHRIGGGSGGSASRALKRGGLFLVVGLLVSFNLVPWASVMEGEWRPAHMALQGGALPRTGRHLLSVSGDPQSARASGASGGGDPYGVSSSSGAEFPQRWQQLRDEIQDGILSGMFNDTSFAGLSMCPSHFNSTESMRLAEQLAGWMVLQEEEQRRKLVKRRREQRRKANHPVKALKTALHGSFQLYNRGGDLGGGREPTYHVQVYQGQPDQRQEFLKAIHRRNDTFYVLSFNTDYFLVPALAHNKTMRPRMSLVMPALGLNETMQPPAGQVGMMQIDCEVFNTQLIHVEKSAVPPAFVNSTFDSQRPPQDNL